MHVASPRVGRSAHPPLPYARARARSNRHDEHTGRSVRSCQNTFQTLVAGGSQSSPTAPIPTAFAPAVQPSMTAAGIGRKRALPGNDTTTSATRTLQPRPTVFGALNGDQAAAMHASSGHDLAQPPKKKRGRPSRAEMEARAAAAALRGELYPPAKSPRTPKPARPADRRSLAGHEDLSSLTAGLSTVASTAAAPSMPAAPGSTGKRRRGRPTKEEAENKRMLREAGIAAEAAAAAAAAAAPQDQDQTIGPANDDEMADAGPDVAGLLDPADPDQLEDGGDDSPDLDEATGAEEEHSSPTI